MIFVSDLHDEHMEAFFLSVEDELGIERCMSGYFAQSPWPPFYRLQGRSIQYKRLRFRVIFRCSMESPDIASMSQLSLAIAAGEFEVESFL